MTETYFTTGQTYLHLQIWTLVSVNISEGGYSGIDILASAMLSNSDILLFAGKNPNVLILRNFNALCE